MEAAQGCILREAALSDAPAIASLVSQLGFPCSVQEMSGRMKMLSAMPEYMTFVAVTDGNVIGLVGAYLGHSLEFSGTFGRLTTLVVDEKWRGRGFGKLLMKKIETWLSDQGALLVVLTSSSNRKDSHIFYRNSGYRETGIRFTKRLR